MKGLALVLSWLTVLPVRSAAPDARTAAAALRWSPVVGGLIGAATGAVVVGLVAAGVPAAVAGFLGVGFAGLGLLRAAPLPRVGNGHEHDVGLGQQERSLRSSATKPSDSRSWSSGHVVADHLRRVAGSIVELGAGETRAQCLHLGPRTGELVLGAVRS